MIGEPVTILRESDTPTGEDSQGNPIYGRTSIVVEGCAVAWGNSGDDSTTAGVRTITGGTVYAPSGTVFLPSDHLLIRGTEYTVDGESGQWTSPFTNIGWGVEVAFKKGA